MMRAPSIVRRLAVCCFATTLLSATLSPALLRGQDDALSPEEQREQVAAERFLQLLLRKPTTGTALERVFGYHVASGKLGELLNGLRTGAEQAAQNGDVQASGRHWMVIGLLQLQRGDEAAAAKALAKAEAALTDNPLAAYYHGQALLQVGRNDDAAAALQRAIDLKPDRRNYLAIASQLGRLHQRSGRTEAALAIWKQLEESFPGDDGVLQRIAQAMAEEGDSAGALARYDALAKEAQSQNDRIIFALRAADMRVQLGQKEQATKDLEQLLDRLRPGSYLYAEARRRIENTFLDAGDYAGLADYYQAWIGEHPNDVGAMLRLARTLSVQGRGAEALVWFEKAIERSPTDTAPRLALIDAYIAQERFADAAAQYEKLVDMEPNNPDYFVRWGQVLLEDPQQPKDQRQAAAAQVWKKLAKARGGDAVIKSQVADLLRGAELTEPALAGYRQAIELAPDQPQYKEYLGEYLHRLDRHDEALVVWRTLAAGDLRTRENLVRLAEVLHQFDEPEEASKTLGEACEMDPPIDVRLRYAEWLRDAKSYDAALAQIRLAGEQTDTVDDRDRVFTAAVQTYQAAGQLDDRIAEAKQAAESAASEGEPWRRLAVLYDANRQTRESLEAIEKAVELSRDSIETLDVAARMYESAGRFGDAVQKRIQLAESDRRFRSGHLQRLASLHMRMGQEEEAIDAGRQLLAGGGGSIESFKFYANLCGQLGRLDERLDTLRRCLRVNPRSEEALQLLAGQLAEDFKTEQAIELYWKMLDAGDDLEERREATRKLADLYLRSNRLDQLVSRLEIRGRESGDRRGTIDLVATAHEQVGDLGLARDALEGLLREQGRDTLLMSRLVALAEKAGEVDRAVELQRQLLRLAPGRQNETKLASLLIDIGAMDEAEALWLRLNEQKVDSSDAARTISRLFAAGEIKVATGLAEKIAAADPGDWEMRFGLAVLRAADGQLEKAAQLAEQLRQMNVDETSLPAGGQSYQNVVQSGGRSYRRPPLKMARLQSMYELQRLLDERYGSSRAASLPKPIDFGHARLMALWVVMKYEHEEGLLDKRLQSAAAKAQSDTATTDDLWQWYETVSIAGSVDYERAVSYQKPETWDVLWKLADADAETGALVLMQLFSNRLSIFARGREVSIGPLSDEKLLWLKLKASEDSAAADAVASYSPRFSWPLFYNSELQIAGRDEEARDFFRQTLDEVLSDRDAETALSLIQQASTFGDDDQLWQLIQFLRSDDAAQSIQQRLGSSAATAEWLGMFASQTRIDKGLTQGAEDAKFRQRVAELIEAMIAEEASKPARRRTLRLTGVGGPRQTYVNSGGTYQRVAIAFPPTGLGPDDRFIASLWSAWSILKDQGDDWIELLQQVDEDAESPERVLRQVIVATILQWSDRNSLAAARIGEAVDFAAEQAQQHEPELRLMLADLLLRQGQKRQALEAIDALGVYDQNTMAVREFAAARLAAAIGDKERAQAAAKRLFGVRLDTDTQIELAKLMRSLEMRELAADLVRRMRTRGGGNTDQLNSLMTYFVAQGDNDQAAEVAMEILRRSAPSRQVSSSYTTAAQARRSSALQTLASTGRLTALIEATEERFKRSPKSQRLRGELAEMFLSAGNQEKAQALLADSIGSGVQSAATLQLAAKQLVAAGKMDQACEAYLQLLRRKPDLLRNEFYEIKRPFEQKKRLGDLADLIIEVGVRRFEMHRVGELCQDMMRNNGKPKAKELYLAMLETPPTASNAMYALNSVITYSNEFLNDENVVEKSQQYMIDASLRGARNWTTLFRGYSTGSDGRKRNAAVSLVDVVGKDEQRGQALEDLIRKNLQENEDWFEGRAWLGTLLAVRKRFDESKELLAPLISGEMQPAPPLDALWVIGSLIDKHPPMKSLALEMYRYALENDTREAYQRSSSDFVYTLENRTCQLLGEMGHKQEARDLVLTAVASMEKSDAVRAGNEEYDAYRKIRTMNSIIEYLDNLGYSGDALRICRNFDMTLFDKAGRYLRDGRETYDKQRAALLEKVRRLGGLATAEAMIDSQTKGPMAVDLGITIGERPFTSEGIQSLWIEMLHQAARDPKQAAALAALRGELESLRNGRPDDDSAVFAHAIAVDITGDLAPLRALIEEWTAPPDPQRVVENPALRESFLALAVLQVSRSASESDQGLVDKIALEAAGKWRWRNRLLLLAALGRQALAENDTDAARRYWRAALSGAQSQLILLDLSQAAVLAEMPALSYDAALVAAAAPEKSIGAAEIKTSADNLGELLGRRSSSSVSPTNPSDEIDPAKVKLARRLLELHDVWRDKRLGARRVFEALAKNVFTESGAGVNPLCTPIEELANDRVRVDSVFDRLAKSAKYAKQTDRLVTMLGDDASSHLLRGLALLRDDRGEAAQQHFAAVDGASLKALPKETVFQALLPALDDEACRKEALRLGTALVGHNKPTQRYQDIHPFDLLAFAMAEKALQNGRAELAMAAINDYLALCEHDNDRYGGDSGISRRVDQLGKVCRILLMKGHTTEALRFAGMRQSIYAMGHDTGNDWIGSWILEHMNGSSDRQRAYQALADWTFEGDGPLRIIGALSRRQRPPSWIPESVSGSYPRFAPSADASFPIVTNWLSLAHLAEETGSSADLLSRLQQARQKRRAGASEALAIALAALARPVPAELLDEIDQQMKRISPGGDKPKTAAPMPAMQLAAMLASHPDHAPWARQIADQFEDHGHRSGRGFLAPWLFRFQYQQGWSEAAKLQNAKTLRHWIPSSNAVAKTYYEGLTPPLWLTDGKSQIDHLCGVGEDRLWLRYPLQGDFEFQVELLDGGWRESWLVGSGINFYGNGNGNYINVISDDYRDYVRYSTAAMKVRDWNQYTLRYQGDQLTYSINGTPIYKESRRANSPWIALQTAGTRHSTARNLRITGAPQVPRSIDLLSGDDLRGWSGRYYSQPLPTIGINHETHEPNAEEARNYRNAPSAGSVNQLAWTIQNGELVSGGAAKRGPQGQSVIRYDRPLAEGETLAYEFYYEAGKTEVHPSIGRTAYLLRPEGVSLHWMTEPASSWKTPHDFEVPVEPAIKAPLKEAAWNQVAVGIEDGNLQIRVGGELVLDRPLELLPQGTVFGLFHYSNQTKARLRKITLSGPWPTEFPADLFATAASGGGE